MAYKRNEIITKFYFFFNNKNFLFGKAKNLIIFNKHAYMSSNYNMLICNRFESHVRRDLQSRRSEYQDF